MEQFTTLLHKYLHTEFYMWIKVGLILAALHEKSFWTQKTQKGSREIAAKLLRSS